MQSFSSRKWRPLSTCLILTLLLAIVALAIVLSSPATASRQTNDQIAKSEKRQREAFIPGEALVRFKKDRAFEGEVQIAVPRDDLSKGLSIASPSDEAVLVRVERFEGSNIVDGLRLARTSPGDTMKAIAALKYRDDVLYAEPNYLLRIDATPNDPRFLSNELYGLNIIAAPLAWDITTGNRNTVVAVIDQGIDINHPDLVANIWTNPSQGSIPGIVGDLHGYNFRDNTGTIPPESHATHVAGTIGAEGNNGTGVVGVNWQVSLMSLRFLPAGGTGTDADAIRAYNYVKQMRDLWTSSNGAQGANVRVVNASYGGGGYSQSAADAINALGQSGVLFVAAAGNESRDTDLQPHYPSGYSLPNVIAVTGTTQTDQQIYNFGARSVLMGAPGVGILSTFPGNAYASQNGTSMATPHVAGAAALLSAANSNLSVNQLRALLAFNGDLIPALQGKSLTGRRLNVFKSLQAISENDTTPPGTVGSLQVNSQNGRSINLSWVASGDDGAAGQASLYDISFVDQSTSAVIPLTTVAPVASGPPAQNLNINLPYRHLAGTIRLREFDNVGNEGTPATVPVSVPLLAADPYVTSLNAASALSTGGTALGLTFDDRYKEDYLLPFPFPFFGQSYNLVTISTNGNLYFSAPPKRGNGDADDVPSSTADLSLRKMISGMWDDLDLRQCFRTDADVYVVQTASDRIIFRWQGVPSTDSTCPAGPLTDSNSFINFEIELRSDGTITTRYGAGNRNLFPVVGISGGEPDPYVIDTLTSETSPKTLTNAQSAVFAPRSSCSYSLVPSSQGFDATGGGSSVSVSTQPICPWSAVSNAPWITITSGGSGTGGGPVNYSVAANTLTTPRSGSMTIAGLTFTVNQNAAPLPVIQLSSPSYSIGEGVAQVSITVNRGGTTSGTSTVDFTTSDTAGSQGCAVTNGAASARCDYVSTARKLTFAPGETTKTIAISIINDAYNDDNETFTVTLSNPTSASLNQSTAPVMIVDDDDSTNGQNPLTNTGFFVRQQYLDFLSREPDTAGFNFWSGQIDNCTPKPQCTEVLRIDVSASFFLSIEFQQTGFFVERFYKAAYNDANGNSTTGGAHTLKVPIVRLNEFLFDTQGIGEGVIVLAPGWETVLENNKLAYALDFVTRTRFTTAFATTLTPAQFVNALFANAGVTPSAAESNAAIAEFGAGATNTADVNARARALRRVVDHATFIQQEFNRAFVLMQYFGYLRRNPDDFQDPDHSGFEFWLNKLNTQGNYINAEMVKAFITSIEYGQRFGQ